MNDEYNRALTDAAAIVAAGCPTQKATGHPCYACKQAVERIITLQKKGAT